MGSAAIAEIVFFFKLLWRLFWFWHTPHPAGYVLSKAENVQGEQEEKLWEERGNLRGRGVSERRSLW